MIYMFAALILPWTLAIIFSATMDTILFRKEHIFSNINAERHPKLHKYFHLDKDWWKRQYIENNPKKGRRKILWFVIPPAVFDAWHGFKLLRQVAYFHAVGAPVLLLYFSGLTEALFVYLVLLGVCTILSYVVHWVFFHNVFKI